MSKATVCDRCGTVLQFACDCKITVYVHPYGDQQYDLCDECKDDVLHWIRNSRFNRFRRGEEK